ncbi:ABC transporter permease [Actinospica sp. MGRD01-02]|uniref:ABC transporter permease n=1 Tax=Actinospica acidithermotolerans TaxID=2828514 RepID=A0A941EED9_9ACTN|nr:ABC transporter permease [Actinospica acidithermotolerans]MBR7831155.1 ABC transporter permease [Actinospica acidithermotolerans]
MKPWEALRLAADALRANRLRSLLTMVGVIIGVAAVVVLVAIGGGAKAEVENEVEGLGSNIVFIVPGKFQFGTTPSLSPLRLSDVQVAARIAGSTQDVTAVVDSGENVTAGQNSFFATVQGVTQNFDVVFNRPLAEGSYLTSADVTTSARVVVLGANVASTLFPNEDPVGRTTAIDGVSFRVVGVAQAQGSAFGVTQDSNVDIPITEAQLLFGINTVQSIEVKAQNPDQIGALSTDLVSALQSEYTGVQFSAVTQSQILGTIGKILSLLTLVLAAIAGISLLVGGVGVSNIMLVGVRERTREIGLRKALGARQRDVVLQFLVEAVTLTAVGGVIGIGLGVGTSAAVGAFSPLPTNIAWWSPALAFGVSVFVGVLFGVVPARRAGRLDPVAALRTD